MTLLGAAVGAARGQAPGSLDVSFNANVDQIYRGDPAANLPVQVSAVALQADGKLLVGGRFNVVNGAAQEGVVRLNTDGGLDPGFNPSIDPYGEVTRVAVQADGKVLLGGRFAHVNGEARNTAARLHPDGSLDAGFNPNPGDDYPEIYSVVAQEDGKVLLGGDFIRFGGLKRYGLARLNADGSLDRAFVVPNYAGNVFKAFSTAVQADGKVVVGGGFGDIGGVPRANLARLNADGSLDLSFDPGRGVDGDVAALAVQSDGKVVLGGRFSSVNGAARPGFARVNADGSPDPSFNPGRGANDNVEAVALQADGKIVIGGRFSQVNGVARRGIARLNGDGSLDAGFDPGSGVSFSSPLVDPVYAVALQTDGKVVIGGRFNHVNDVPRGRLARLHGGEFSGAPAAAAPVISVVGTGRERGGFVVSRPADAAGSGLTVLYHNGGSASRGQDYEALSGSLFLAAGQTEAVIPVRLLAGANRNKKVKVILDPSPAGDYLIAKTQSKVFLSDLP